MRIYGNSISGNCQKVKLTADFLGLSYDWIETDVLKNQTRTREFLAMNPAGQAPVVVLDSGKPLAQSNAIIFHLAEGSALIPSESYARAKMLEWLFWEQYSHEPYVAVARFQVKYLGRSPASLEPRLVERAKGALQLLEESAGGDFLLGSAFSLADIALVPYTRMAEDGALSLGDYPRVRAWIGRVEQTLGLGPYASTLQ